jgi:hypothetical protein
VSSPRNAKRIVSMITVMNPYTRAPTIHATGDLSSLLVAPTNGSKVSFVVHEATIEMRLGVWVARLDMDLLEGQNDERVNNGSRQLPCHDSRDIPKREELN